VHVDNGSPYVSHHFKRVCADLGIRVIHATPYHPAGKGRVERFLRTVQTSLRPRPAPWSRTVGSRPSTTSTTTFSVGSRSTTAAPTRPRARLPSSSWVRSGRTQT
jgi:transposase InsO family protein